MSVPKSTQIPFSVSLATRARLYALLAGAWRFPDPWLVQSLRKPASLGLAPDSSSIAPVVESALRELMSIKDQLQDRSDSFVLEELCSSYARLFGHSVRGTCPPYELEYGTGEIIQQTAELADLAGFYSAFGLNLQDSAFERADHISVECEFMAILCAKEAWGLDEGNHDLAETCSDAQRLFLRDHLARWLPAFAHRVAALDQDGFYGKAANLADTFLTGECERFGIEAGPQWLEIRPADPERDAEIECDSGSCPETTTADRLVQLGMDSLSGGRK